MKRFIAVLVLLTFGAAGSMASNYPPEYFYQNARVVSRGPAVIARVSSGIMNKLVIGYKSTGILGSADSVSAVVRVTSTEYYSGYNKTIERVINIPKEWNGTGFMTQSMDMASLIPGGFAGDMTKIEVAFFAGQQWDSNYGANYVVERDAFDKGALFTSRSGGYDVNTDCWNFIVQQMRK